MMSGSHQCGYSEDLNRQRSDGYTPLVIVTDEILLQLLIVLQDDKRLVSMRANQSTDSLIVK